MIVLCNCKSVVDVFLLAKELRSMLFLLSTHRLQYASACCIPSQGGGSNTGYSLLPMDQAVGFLLADVQSSCT